MIALWVEGESITGAVFGSSMYLGLWSFVNFANQPIFIFIRFLRFLWPCSTKIWQMTVLHQNLRNDRAPPKFKKWPRSTEKSQFVIFICSPRFLWIFHVPGSIKIKRVISPKLHVPGPMKYCQIYHSTNFYFDPLSKVFMNSSLTLPMILDPVFSKLHSGYGHASCLISKLSWGTAYHFLHPFVTWAGSHQKFTWHWAFSSIPKRITSWLQ